MRLSKVDILVGWIGLNSSWGCQSFEPSLCALAKASFDGKRRSRTPTDFGSAETGAQMVAIGDRVGGAMANSTSGWALTRCYESAHVRLKLGTRLIGI